MRQSQRDGGERPGSTPEEKARIKDLEREVHELRRANEILRKASWSPGACTTTSRSRA
jgi:transposase